MLKDSAEEVTMAEASLTWTKERIDLLTKLWSEGLSASQIAAELGESVSRNAVISKAHRLGLAHGAPNCLVAEHSWDRVRWAIEEFAWRFERLARSSRPRRR
jgi:GcrA cell cycle regulator